MHNRIAHGLADCGTLFAALLVFAGYCGAQTPAPALTTLHTFVNGASDGIVPQGVAVGSGGVIYGTTARGGASGYGTVFSLTPPAVGLSGAWTETVLYSFTGRSDGGGPLSVAIGKDGVLYGTTAAGGTGTATCAGGCGTVFSLTPPALPGGAWTESVLYSFTGGNDGGAPAAGVAIGSGPGGSPVLYGTTAAGGPGPCISPSPFPGCGVVFSLAPPAGTGAGASWTEAVLYNLTSPSPTGLAIDSSGVLYGATQAGGTGTNRICSALFGCGTVYSLTPPKGSPTGSGAWTPAVLYNFSGGNDGFQPSAVTIGSGGVLYGTNNSGGASGAGTVFSLTPSAGAGGAWTESVLYTFTGGRTDGANPASGVVIGNGGILYGTASAGGAATAGAVFSLTPPSAGSGAWTESLLYSFKGGNDGALPYVGVVFGGASGSPGVLYGATAYGGPANAGTVFTLTPPTSTTGAWTESVLYAFAGGAPGSAVLSGVVAGSGGVLYGTSQGGGIGSCPSGCGTVFSLTPPVGTGAWTASVPYRFTGGADGAYPAAGVVIGSNGVLYGATELGGTGSCTGTGQPPGCGVVFSLTPPALPGGAWTETTLHNFSLANGTCNPGGCSGFTDGYYPTTGVTLGSGGTLYGTTGSGGSMNSGTAFSLTPPAVSGGAWTGAVLYDFTAFTQYNYSTTAGPSGLAIGSGGVLYGTTSGGGNTSYNCAGAAGCGTVFSLTPPAATGGAWTESTVYEFPAPASPGNASNPAAGVVVGNGGVLYGTSAGGTSYQGTLFSVTPPLVAGGDWTGGVLYNFTGSGSAGSPSGLAMGNGGVLYGTTPYGSGSCTTNGSNGCGTVFALIPPPSADGVWAEATLYNFTGGSDGANPMAGVTIGSGGVLYGTTTGTNSATVFSLTVGNALSPSINPGGVVNAASYTAPVAPGSIASIFGNFLLSSPLGATQSPLPDDLSGLSLQFGGETGAPLFFVSGGQVNFQVPWELSGQSQATLAATLDNAAGAAQTVNLAPVAPAIFSTNAAGTGQGAILDTSYRLVDSTNPAAPGSFVLIYCTGLGAVSNRPATGSPAPSDPLAESATPIVTIGGVTANVQFSGLAPGYVGLYQVNAQVPAGSATGSSVSVTISMGGVTSNTVTMAVQ
ncbi:MAG: choice-of-anchor tandem repeat GloVer-containing protein [Bryobacteraceae bacterium]|jgi:uncharacterized protein (TIGR03437 family)